MEEEKKPFYRYCMVPMCPNNIKSTPDKVFFAVPRDSKIRKQWCEVMRREYNVSSISRLHCCEDHFNIKEDTVNYIKYKLMKEQGEKVKLFLNKGVMPHKFQCQKRNAPRPQERMYDSKKRLSLINESCSKPEVNSENVLERETSQIYCDEGPSTSYIEGCENDPGTPSTSVMDVFVIESSTSHVEVSTNTENFHSDKCVQTNKRPNFRSKSVQVNLTTTKTNVGLSPFLQNIGSSPIKLATAADRVNAILVNVYRYFASEGTELSPSQLRERTALCTGASEADVECALVLHQDSHVVSATQKPLRKPPRKRRKKESKSPSPIQEEEPYIERETLIVTVDPKAGDANSEVNPLAIKEEQPSSPITCEQDASFCEPQQSGLKPEDMATVFVKTEPTEEPNTGPSQSSQPEQSSAVGPMPDIPPDTYFMIKNEEIDIEDNCGSGAESEEGYS